MSDSHAEIMEVLNIRRKRAFQSDGEAERGGFISGNRYVWFTNGATIVLCSKDSDNVMYSKSFDDKLEKSLKITFVKELLSSETTNDLLLVGCSFKASGILFICLLPNLTTINCIALPNPISYISTIINESLAEEDQLCDHLKIMSTVLLVGMKTGAVYAIDLKQRDIEEQLRTNKMCVNELRPSQVYNIRINGKNQFQEINYNCGFHSAMFINENTFYFNKPYNDKLNITSLLYNEEINSIAVGYSTGHFQLWDCKVMRNIYLLEPKCDMPITHITFLEPSNNPNNILCYLWIIQSDNCRLPNAMMIALTYEQRTIMSNGCSSYRVLKEKSVKFEMSLWKESSGIGRCISALSLCKMNFFRNETDVNEDCEIRLFAMLMEIRQNINDSPESYIFLFDINQWYKAQMPSNINHLKVSNSYASFVKLPHNFKYLDLTISVNTLRPFDCNFRKHVEELYYPSSIYFEYDCLLDTKIIKFKHAGVQQNILDQLLSKNWKLLNNPSLIFNQCLQTNLQPFFWDKTENYSNYSLVDQRDFIVSIIVENKCMSILEAYAEEWKCGTDVSSDAIIHLMLSLWNHVMLVKQYANQLCVPLFDGSSTFDETNVKILNHCLPQLLCVKHFFKGLRYPSYHKINDDLFNRVKILNMVIKYFEAIICFLDFELLPEPIGVDLTSLNQYANKRRMEFGDLPLYLIDTIISNDSKRKIIINQWQHEVGEETKGLYPPSNVQCLLRIHLNTELSQQVKNVIAIYFLIDVCSLQDINVLTENRLTSFAVENKGLLTFAHVSWLLDHDMFEDAMLILTINNELIIGDVSWNWYHWTVLKLLEFKEQYYWAYIYLELFEIQLVNLEDHKFYINLLVMNNRCFDALCHVMDSSQIDEQQILFEFIFDRCKQTNQLKSLLSYPLDFEQNNLFISYLKKFEETESIQLMCLLQKGRISEAFELHKSLKAKINRNNHDALTIASVLVGMFKDNIPPKDQSGFLKKKLYNEEIEMKFNIDSMDLHVDKKNANVFKRSSNSNLINLIIPVDNDIHKSPQNTKQDLGENCSKFKEVLNPSNIRIVKPIEKELLQLLDTLFIQNINNESSVTNQSSDVKIKPVADYKQLLEIKLDKTPQTFGVQVNNDIKIEKFSHKEGMNNLQNTDPENENVELYKDNCVEVTHPISYETIAFSRNTQAEMDDMLIDSVETENMISGSVINNIIKLLDDEQMPVSVLLPDNTSSTSKVDIKLLTSNYSVFETPSKFVPIDIKEIFHPNTLDKINKKPRINDGTTDCLILEADVNDAVKKKKKYDSNLILLDSKDNESNSILSVDPSSEHASFCRIVSENDILENKRYHMLKSQMTQDYERSENSHIKYDELNSGSFIFINEYVDNDLEKFVENEEYHSEMLADELFNNNKYNLEKIDGILNYTRDSNSLEAPAVIDKKNNDNLKEPYGIPNYGSEIINAEEIKVIQKTTEQNILEQDVLFNYENEIINVRKEIISEEPHIILDACDQNTITLFEILQNEEKSSVKNNTDPGKIIYSKDSQSKSLENHGSLFDNEDHTNYGNQIYNEDDENSHSILIKDNEFVNEGKDNITEVVENIVKDNKASVPIQVIENHTNDIYYQNEDFPCYEYAFPTNDIFPELSRNKFNPIPEYDFNHLTMTTIEADKLKLYDMDVHQSSAMLDGSYFDSLNLDDPADKVTQNSVVNNHIENITDEVSEKINSTCVSQNSKDEKTCSNIPRSNRASSEPKQSKQMVNNLCKRASSIVPCSSNTNFNDQFFKKQNICKSKFTTNITICNKNKANVNTNLKNQEVAHQLVKSKDIELQHIDKKILNSEDAEYIVDIPNIYPSVSLETIKAPLKEFSPNDSTINNEIYTEEEKANLVIFVKTDTESDKNSAKNQNQQINLHSQNLNTYKKCELPLKQLTVVLKRLSFPIQDIKLNESFINKKIVETITNQKTYSHKAKFIPSTNTKVITRLSGKSEIQQVQFPTSEMTEDNSRHVSVSKKRSKCQKRVTSKKRKSHICPKNTDHVEGETEKKPNLKIGLKQKFEKGTSSSKLQKNMKICTKSNQVKTFSRSMPISLTDKLDKVKTVPEKAKSNKLIESKGIETLVSGDEESEYSTRMQNSCPSSGQSTTVIEELIPNALHNKDVTTTEKLTKLVTMVTNKPDSDNDGKTLNQNCHTITPTDSVKNKFIPYVLLERMDYICNERNLLKLSNKQIPKEKSETPSEKNTGQLKSAVDLKSNITNIIQDGKINIVHKMTRNQKKFDHVNKDEINTSKSIVNKQSDKNIPNKKKRRHDKPILLTDAAIKKRKRNNSNNENIKSNELSAISKNSSQGIATISLVTDDKDYKYSVQKKTSSPLTKKYLPNFPHEDDASTQKEVAKKAKSVKKNSSSQNWKVSHNVKSNTQKLINIQLEQGDELEYKKKSGELDTQAIRRTSRKIVKTNYCSCCSDNTEKNLVYTKKSRCNQVNKDQHSSSGRKHKDIIYHEKSELMDTKHNNNLLESFFISNVTESKKGHFKMSLIKKSLIDQRNNVLIKHKNGLEKSMKDPISISGVEQISEDENSNIDNKSINIENTAAKMRNISSQNKVGKNIIEAVNKDTVQLKIDSKSSLSRFDVSSCSYKKKSPITTKFIPATEKKIESKVSYNKEQKTTTQDAIRISSKKTATFDQPLNPKMYSSKKKY